MSHNPKSLRRSVIASVAHYLPDTEVTSEDVESRVFQRGGLRIPTGLIARVTGVRNRHYRASGEQASDLAVQAGRIALDRAGLKPSDIQVLIFASCTQDITEPATVNIVQDKLAATNAHGFDVKNACNSFLNALDLAESLVSAGKASNALVTVGETPSLSINWSIDSAESLRTGIAGLTLGDAGGAAIIQPASNGSESGIEPSMFRTFGDKWRLATVLGGGSMHCFDQNHVYFTGNPSALKIQAVRHVPPIVEQVLKRVGWSPDDLDVVCCHQVTLDLIDTIAARCKIDPQKCVVSIEHCGNTAAASIPIGLSTAFERGLLQPGKKVLLVGAAAGFSVGVIPVVW